MLYEVITKEIVASVPFNKNEVCLKVTGKGLDLQFYYGTSPENMKSIGEASYNFV